MSIPTLTLLLSALSLLPTTHALGRAIVTNQCDAPLYLWSVGGTISPQTVLSRSTSYSETFHRDPLSGGIAIKLSAIPNGIFTPNVSQTIFAYNLDSAANTIWYDLSAVFGDGFAGRTIKITPTDGSCDSITWSAGKQPAGSQVRSCGAEGDLELSFCTGGCLPSWSPCGAAAPGETRVCCTHCIGGHHCVAAP
jgi:hypothetical protein